MYTISLHFKPIQMYTNIIIIHFKAKSSVYISSLKHKNGHFFLLVLKLHLFLKTKPKKLVLSQIFSIIFKREIKVGVPFM